MGACRGFQVARARISNLFKAGSANGPTAPTPTPTPSAAAPARSVFNAPHAAINTTLVRASYPGISQHAYMPPVYRPPTDRSWAGQPQSSSLDKALSPRRLGDGDVRHQMRSSPGSLPAEGASTRPQCTYSEQGGVQEPRAFSEEVGMAPPGPPSYLDFEGWENGSFLVRQPYGDTRLLHPESGRGRVSVNSGVAHEFDGPLFVGRIAVYLKGLPAVKGDSATWFEGKRRRSWIIVQGRFKQRVATSECSPPVALATGRCASMLPQACPNQVIECTANYCCSIGARLPASTL